MADWHADTTAAPQREKGVTKLPPTTHPPTPPPPPTAEKIAFVVTHEAVSSGFARLLVRDHHRLVDVAETLEIFPERRVVGVVRKPPDEYLGVGGVFLHGGVHYF